MPRDYDISYDIPLAENANMARQGRGGGYMFAVSLLVDSDNNTVELGAVTRSGNRHMPLIQISAQEMDTLAVEWIKSRGHLSMLDQRAREYLEAHGHLPTDEEK